MEPHLKNGWLVVPYDGPELVVIEIGLGGRWIPAYLDWEDGQRVAQIRWEGPFGTVEVRWRHAGAGP